MNRKNIWKRIVSECLVLAMVFTTIFAQPGLMAKAAGENEMSIAFDKVDGDLFNFQGTLSNGQTLQAAGYDWSIATGTIQVATKGEDESFTWSDYVVPSATRLSFAAGAANLIIWYDAVVTKDYDAIKIEEGTVFTFDGKTSVKITNTLHLVKNSSGVWEEVVPDKTPVDSAVSLGEIVDNKYVQIAGYGNGGIMVDREIDVETSATYTLSFDVKIENISGSGLLRVGVEEWDSSWANWRIKYVDVGDTGYLTSATDGWQTVTTSYTPTDNRIKTKIRFETWGMTSDVCLDNITLTKQGAESPIFKEDFTTNQNVVKHSDNPTGTISFPEDKAWVFNATGLDSITAQYFTGTVEIDGKNVKIPMEKEGSQLKVPNAWFSLLDNTANVPAESFKIPAGAILTQADPDNGWAEIAGGDRIKNTQLLLLENTADSWVQVEAVHEIEMSLSEVRNNDQEWIFNTTPGMSQVGSALRFIADVKIDGNSGKMVLEKSGEFIMTWGASYFTEAGGQVPTDSLEIPAGTVFYEIEDPTTVKNWTTKVPGGTQLVVTKEVEVVKNGTTWEQYTEPEASYETEVHLTHTNGYEWHFDSTQALSEITTATFFIGTVTVDGTESNVVWGIDRGKLVIWGEAFFTNPGGSVPQNSMTIPANTVFYEIDPDGTGWTTKVPSGTQLVVTNEVKIVKDGTEWKEKTIEQHDITVGFKELDPDKSWILTATNLSAITESYYKASVVIDGTKKDILLSKTDIGFTIWNPSFFEALGGSVPTSSFVLEAGTVLTAVDDKAAWAEIEGKDTFKVAQTLDVRKNGDTWEVYVAPEAVLNTELGYAGGETDGTWYFSSIETLPTAASAPFFMATIKVDGVDTKVAIQNEGSRLTIWPNFFTQYQGSAPSSSLIIPAGTVLYEIDPNGTGWDKVVSGGTQIVAAEELKVTKNDGVWEAYVAPEAVYKTVVNLVSANGYEWHFDSTQKLSEITTAKFFIGTVVIDGKESKMVWDITDNQLVIWGEAYYTNAGGVAPTKSFAIPAGTIFYEIAPTETGWKTAVSGGTQLVVTNEFKVEKLGSSWISFDKKEDLTSKPNNIIFDKNGSITIPATEPYFVTRLENNETVSALNKPGTYDITSVIEKVTSTAGEATASALEGHENISLSYNKITTANEWYFAVKSGSLATATSDRFYKVPATIDGKATFVVITVPANSTELIIWSNFFAAVPGADSVAPTKELKIAAGAVMTPVSSSGWGETSGTPIQVQNDLSVNITKILQTTRTVVYVTGDVTLDMAIDSRDIVALKKIATMNANATLSHAGLAAGDVDNNGVTGAADLRLLCQKLLQTATAGKVLTKGKTYAIANGAMPIIGYDGPDYNADRGAAGKEADFITDEIYALVKEAGINTVVSNYNQIGTDYTTASKMLQLAEDNGLRVFLHDAYVSDKDNPEQVKTADAMKANIAKYSMYNSFAGYYLYDEPYKSTAPDKDSGRLTITDFETPLGLLKDSANVNGYMNLFPNISTQIYGELDNPNPSFWDQLFGNDTLGDGETVTEANYKSYLTQAVQSGMEFISYDYYLRGNDYKNDKYAFYQNMKWASDVADAQGVPFYAFIQVGTSFKDDNTGNVSQSNLTTVQEMYLEANAALAMGAKGLNYYSLIQPLAYAKNSNGSYDVYRSGLININGERNNGAGGANYEYFNAAKKINTFVAEVDEVLMHSVKKAAIATDSNVKSQVGGVVSCGSVSSVSGNNALVGCFDYCGKEAYMVVNTSCDAGTTGSTQTITLNFYSAKGYTYTGMDCVEHTGNNKSLTLSIPAGEAVLVVLD